MRSKVIKAIKELKLKKLSKSPPKKISKCVEKTLRFSKSEKPTKKVITPLKKSKSVPKEKFAAKKKTLNMKKSIKKDEKPSKLVGQKRLSKVVEKASGKIA
jgi:hypothetical protein